VRGPSGLELDVDKVIDSAFTASLALPAATVASLSLARQSGGGEVLADGSVRHFDIYAAEVECNRGWRPVLVSAVGGEALVGMRLRDPLPQTSTTSNREHPMAGPSDDPGTPGMKL
jgi:predicted aspartyl protease